MQKTFSHCFVLLAFAGATAFAQMTYTVDTIVSSATTLGEPFHVTNSATLFITGAALSNSGYNAYIGGTNTTAGTGFLDISEGGSLSNSAAYLGYVSGSSGTATVTGSGSGSDLAWSNSASLFVGYGGTGALTVSAGALVTSDSGFIGATPGATGSVTITGANSAWTNNAGLHIGQYGTGSLTVADGASVANSTSYIGYQTGSVGTVIITGAGSVWTNSTALNIGNIGAGALTMSEGGTVSVGDGSGTVTLASDIGTGTLNIGAAADSTAAASGILNAATVTRGSGAATLQFNTTGGDDAPTYFTRTGTSSGTGVNTSGALDFVHTAGTTVFTGTLAHTGATTLNGGTTLIDGDLTVSAVTVNAGATFGGSGTIGGVTTISSGAHLAPGSSAGTLTFNADLTLNSGAILDFELGSLKDHIDVTGGFLTGSGGIGGITLNLFDSGGFTEGTYLLFDFTGATLSGFDLADFVFGTTLAGFDYNLELSATTLSLVATTSAIPEPSTYAVLASLLALAFVAVRRIPGGRDKA